MVNYNILLGNHHMGKVGKGRDGTAEILGEIFLSI